MEEVNQNFNYHIEYIQKISNLDNVKTNYEKQITIFERLKLDKNYDSVGNFWIYSAEIKNEIIDFNNLIISNIKTTEFLSEKKMFELKKDVFSFYDLHLTYENSAFRALEYFYDNRQSDFLLEYDTMKSLQLELFEKIDNIEQTLQSILNSSKLSTEYIIGNFQTSQWILIIIIGIVTTMLVFFLNQTSTNLKIEIRSQTKNLRKLNEKLRKMDKKRGKFISIASHELKGPLQPIFGFVELAKTGIISHQEALRGIADIAVNLENIANNLLDLTKIENDELELHLEKSSINDIILEVISSEEFNPERKVPIKTRLDVDIMINLDKTRIKQVFRNILDNCIKFTKSGEITIQSNLLQDKKTLKISITDTGPEIPKDVLSKIFKKYGTKGNNDVDGFGIGLYISKKIVDAHKGKISAHNYNGKPVFEITLPIIAYELEWKEPNPSDLEKIN
ncbi:MAG: HAMP domain-containing histidine kinase [Thaumarchaeota archaeon]|nr:HAMP domain-containing histidine kinase [Nitrososphaerota archaeon]